MEAAVAGRGPVGQHAEEGRGGGDHQGGYEHLDPNTIRWSRFYNRSPFATSSENEQFVAFQQLIAASEGNEIPILVFPVELDADGHLYEAVYGHRRLEACRAQGCQVKAVIQHGVSPQEQGRLQLIENEGQSRLSVVERGKQIASQLSQGIWPNVGTLATKIGYTRTHAQHLKTIGEYVPDGLLLAHPDPTTINFRTAQKIVSLAKDDLPTLNERIDVLRKERDNLPPKDATAYLLTGQMKAENHKPPSPQALVQRRRDGLQVTIQGMRGGGPEGFETSLRAFLTDNGISVRD